VGKKNEKMEFGRCKSILWGELQGEMGLGGKEIRKRFLRRDDDGNRGPRDSEGADRESFLQTCRTCAAKPGT